MLRIALCDDIPAHSKQLLSLLESEVSTPFEAAAFASPDELLAALDAQQYFDLFFLDIELGEASGVELARRINARLPMAQIIFVTANIMNAVEISEANHTYFLLKPVEAGKLRRAFLRATAALCSQTDKRLSLPLRSGGDAVVSSGKIIYCERVLRVTTVVCTDETLYTPLSLTALEDSLPKLMYARPHSSFLVNLMHVSRTDWQHVYLDNGAALSLTTHNRTAFREALAAYAAQ